LGLVGRDPAQDSVIELVADRSAGRYVTTTLEGEGAGTEIRVRLTERAAHVVDVEVEFHLPEADPARLARLGAGYAEVYARLWDEDEAMMHAREAALALSTPLAGPGDERIDLGDATTIADALPFDFALAGRRYRLVCREGELVAYSTVCPHWLGPLDAHADVAGQVRCPWHGYRFDVRSRQCLDVRGLRLAPAPRIAVESGRVVATRP
jgi:nitrite reductase/ring-hydroxylating ferredoxin subunit